MTTSPTGRLTAEATATTAAPIEDVWALLADARGWSRWSALWSSGLEREGHDEPDGIGAIRRFRTGAITSREEVVAFEPPRRLGYVLLSGMPLRHYRADVTLEPLSPGGTRITWRSTFDPKIPGTGWLMRGFVQIILGDFARRLARAAVKAR